MDRYIGRLLDNRYEILEVIGTGGMAVVYKARCHRLNRLVAIKILKDEYSQDEEFRRRFQAEGQAVAMLSHPNIVSVYDVSSSDDAHYIVMELIDGITLKQYMEKKGVLNWKETLHFAMQIGKALEHAHSRGIVHRDIKPHNVMVLKNGSVKVADFGIARVMSKSNTLTKEALGSVHYISPEQAKGGRVDNRSDLYSLGVVMYEMMAGRPPYDGESPVAVAIKHINGGALLPSVYNPNIPGGMEQIIMKAMAQDPNDRYRSATELLYDMDEFRKNPSMLFQRDGALDDATIICNTPLSSPEVKTEFPAEKAQPVRNSSEQPAPIHPAGNRPKQPKNRKQEGSGGTKAATIAVIACSAVAVLAIIIFLVTLFDDGGFLNQKPELYEVPSLVGKFLDDVQDNENFVIVHKSSVHNNEFEKNKIIAQHPDAGDKVNKGNKIYVEVSLGPEPVAKTMENLVDMEGGNAIVFLEDQGYVVLKREEFSDNIKLGNVTRTDPKESEQLRDGQTITVWISQGKEIKKEKMPHVVGQQLEMALTILEASGFENVTPEMVESAEREGIVIDQSVNRNEKVDITEEIILKVSKGPKETIPEPTAPSEDPIKEKLVTIYLPEKTEPMVVSLRQGETKIVDDITLEAGTKSLDVKLTGSGIQKYELYIDGVLDKKIFVDFTENG